jgi:4-amino-4-deoxy-L-arabinose transferase-like glycosyltransferase
MRKHVLLLLLVIALASFAIEAKFASQPIFPIHGNWANNDHSLVIPAAYYLSGKGYFQNDFSIVEYVNAYPTLLFQLLAGAYDLMGGMQVAYFLLFLILKIIFVFSTFLLAKLLLKDDRLALLAVLVLAFTHFMGSEEIGVSEVVAKGFVFAFMPLLFYLFLKDTRKFAVPVSLGLGALTYFHVISTVPVVIAMGLLLLWKRDFKLLATCAVAFAIVSLPFFVGLLQAPAVDTASLKLTAPYSTLENGGRTVLKYVPIMLVGLLVAWKKDKRVAGMMGVFVAYSLLSFLTLLSDAFIPYTFFRAARFVIFFSFIFTVYAVFRMLPVGRWARFVVFLALVVIPFSSINYSNLMPFMQPDAGVSQTQNLMEVGAWIDANTDKDAILLAPPEWPALRVWSKRSIVITENDLWIGAVRPTVQMELRKRYEAVSAAYANSTIPALTQTAKEYNASYVVQYGAGNFSVYKIEK